MVDRTPFREQVYRELVDRILSGKAPPGSRMSDRALSEELQVSRTPIREALMRLEREALLSSDLHRGFFVQELTVPEVRQVYPVVAMLEGGLVESIERPPAALIRRLRDLNERLEQSDHDPVGRVELDMEWHEALTSAAHNPYADGLLASAKNLVRRYEYAYMRDAGHVPLSVRMHEDIVAAMQTSDPATVRRLVENHWRFGMKAVERWLTGADAVSPN